MRLRILLFLMISAVWVRQCLAQQSHQTAGLPPVQGEIADDSLRMWADKVAAYARKTPQEIVSVHMDNTCYFLGDTIWYKAYVVREGKMIPSDISGVLYAELLNQDGYLVERQMLRLQNRKICGQVILIRGRTMRVILKSVHPSRRDRTKKSLPAFWMPVSSPLLSRRWPAFLKRPSSGFFIRTAFG